MNCEQAFAIVRLDTFLEVEFASRPEAIAVEKGVWTRQGAESEVLRLNRSNEHEGTVYFWTFTRVEQR
jgi:hypothetical protein